MTKPIRLTTSNNSSTLKECKTQLLLNAFLLTSKPIKVNVASSHEQEKDNVTKKVEDDLQIIDSDDVMPTHIRKAIDRLQSKGAKITVDSIRNHLPLGQMSTSARLECNRYLKKLQENQK